MVFSRSSAMPQSSSQHSYAIDSVGLLQEAWGFPWGEGGQGAVEEVGYYLTEVRELSWQPPTPPFLSRVCTSPAQYVVSSLPTYQGISEVSFPSFLWSASSFKNTLKCFPSRFQSKRGWYGGSNIIICQCGIVCSALGRGLSSERKWMSNFGPSTP